MLVKVTAAFTKHITENDRVYDFAIMQIGLRKVDVLI